MRPQELRSKSNAELQSLLGDERHRLLDLRMKKEGSQLKNVKEIKKVRKNIARIMTILSNI